MSVLCHHRKSLPLLSASRVLLCWLQGVFSLVSYVYSVHPNESRHSTRPLFAPFFCPRSFDSLCSFYHHDLRTIKIYDHFLNYHKLILTVNIFKVSNLGTRIIIGWCSALLVCIRLRIQSPTLQKKTSKCQVFSISH